jgi:6-phosphogluconolactonase/glucosamine-6-phosphate isomerase/deaminase
MSEDKLGLMGIIDKAAEMGFEGIEFSDGAYTNNYDLAIAEKIKARCEEKGLEVVSFCAGANFLGDTDAEIARLEALIRVAPIDVACVGIGENGHLAFNDPPADFDCNRAYKVVPLDDKCRMQQVGEGWFATKDDVPTHAFSMTIKQIMWAKAIVCTCPDERKAEAVKGAIEGPITNTMPSSVMQLHPDCGMFLDPGSASLLKK